MSDHNEMTIEEAHNLCSLAGLLVHVTEGTPVVVNVGKRFFEGSRSFGEGRGETRDEAFIAAMQDYRSRFVPIDEV